MNYFIFGLTSMFTLISSILISRRIGDRSTPLTFALLFVFVLAPISSLISFRDFDYQLSIMLIATSSLALILPIFISSIRLPYRKQEFLEKGIILNPLIISLLILGFAISLFGTFKIYQMVFSIFPISNLNDLNIAMLSERLPSFGIYGRMNRLSIVLGIISLCGLLFSEESRDKKIFAVFLFAFTALLLGVRRATLVNQLIIYIIIFLGSRKSSADVLKSIVVSGALIFGIIYFFGAVQIATNKSQSNNAILSGMNDGLLYISGNLPYAECVERGAFEFDKKNSFPFIYMLFDSKNDVAIEKPFCDIDNGQLFNTSPIYFDLFKDKGYPFLIAVMSCIGIALSIIYFGYVPILGIQAILTSAVVFGIRENQIGQYDTIFSLLLYPIALGVFKYLSKQGVKNE